MFLAVIKMNSTNSSSIEISPHLLWYKSLSSTMALVSPGVSLVISLSCVITLNTYLKQLHNTFKTLLNIILTSNIISEILLICLNIYMMSTHHQDFIICLIRTMLSATQTFMTTFCITMMSFLRYHIAWKITNLESTKKTLCYAISITIWYGLFELFNTGALQFAFAIFYDSPNKGTVCAGGRPKNGQFSNFTHLQRRESAGCHIDWSKVRLPNDQISEKEKHPSRTWTSQTCSMEIWRRKVQCHHSNSGNNRILGNGNFRRNCGFNAD